MSKTVGARRMGRSIATVSFEASRDLQRNMVSLFRSFIANPSTAPGWQRVSRSTTVCGSRLRDSRALDPFIVCLSVKYMIHWLTIR